MTWHFLKSHVQSVDVVENQAFKFYNRVFAPALSLVVATFIFGWLLAKPDLVDSVVALIVMAIVGTILIYRSRQKEFNPRISIAVYFGTIMLSPFIFGISKKLDGNTSNTVLAVLTGLFLAYCLGVTEVANRFHFASQADLQKKLWLPSTESANFYHAGANWAGFVFIPTLPLLALFHQHIPVWSVFAYSFVLTVVWCKKDKSTLQFRRRSIVLGLLMPVTIILGTVLARTIPEWAYLVPLPANSSVSMSDRVATILGVLLTVVFVLLQSDFSKLSQNLRNVHTYIDLRNCYLLYFLAASFVNLYAVVVGSVSPQSADGLDPAAFSRKIQELQILSLASIVVVLVIYFWTEEPGSTNGDSASSSRHCF